ncbi:MarP family serine protease [Streptomyces lavenduligriseus]|uniref:MarP family serine protease n=1 Tax=Streptomyces lavenduligriseus TaxID=67315 RepID=A0ABT0NQH5_9ACTN|nr:MarP family serine protease [Streptomyces lavenduligriseus]MCL3993720.1 MarP family serine protease [Streptomyces lavenduligriseus]
MNLLDLLLAVVAVCSAVSGYRRGLLAGCVSPAGFAGGAAVGMWLLPWSTGQVRGSAAVTALAAVTLLVPAVLGHALAGRAARRLRGRMGRGPLRVADGVGGASVHAVAVLVVASVAAGVLGAAPAPALTAQVRDSTLLGAVRQRMPETTPAWFARATSALSEAGFPRVSGPFADEPAARPDGDGVPPAAARAARSGTVKVEGFAGAEGREGSGFVYASRRVLTNAHVVAGIDRPGVRVGGSGRSYPARVVLFDPGRDVAVLYVPGLRAPALRFAPDAGRGDPAVVAGYPEDGGLDLRAAKVTDRVRASGPDIYDEHTVTRELYAIRSEVLPGNSGGPLLAPDGRVLGMVFARSASDAGTGYVLTAAELTGDARRAATATARVDTGELVAA